MVGSLNGFEQGLYVLAHFTIAIYGPPNMVNGSVYDYGECSLQLHAFEKVFFYIIHWINLVILVPESME